MASSTPTPPPIPSLDPTRKPTLQKPPGYKSHFTDPTPPPRKQVLPPTLRPKKKRRCGCCCICCCIIFIIIFLIIFVAAIAAGLIYIVYDPKLPEFQVGYFRLNNLNVTQKPDGVYLNTETTMRLEVKNKSGKMGWLFDETKVEVTAENGELNLGTTTVPGFEVKEKGLKELNADTRIRDIALNERLGKKVLGKEVIPVVEIRTKTGVGMSGWKSWKIGVTVVCGDKSLKQLEGGDTPKCTLTTLKWIKIHF